MNKLLTTVLEITQTHVKLIQAKNFPAGKLITALNIKNIADTTNESVSRAIKELVAECKIKPENLICVIPRSSTIVRILRLPSQEPAEIENMLDFQIKQQIPYSKEDIITDYAIIKKHENGYSDILLVTAHKDVIDRYLNILNSIDISPAVFSLSSLGICKWYCLYQANLKKPMQGAAFLVNIDSTETDLCFCSEKNIVFSRSISFGLNDLNNERIEGLIEQIHLTLVTYGKEKISPEVSKIILITQSPKQVQLRHRLETEFSLPVEIIDSFDNIPKAKNLYSLTPAALSEVSATACLGMALKQGEDELNLLPDDVIQKQKTKMMRKELVLSGVLLILIMFFAAIAVAINIYNKEQYLKQLEAKLQEINPTTKKVEDTTKKLELIREYLDSKGSSIDIIYELYNILPPSMSLNVLNMDEQGNLALQGTSTQMSDIFNFQSKLEKSALFKNIEVKYASKRKTNLGEITDFRIVCQIKR